MNWIMLKNDGTDVDNDTDVLTYKCIIYIQFPVTA